MYHKQILKSIYNYKVNVIIRVLILSDFLIWSSSQLLSPIFAIFITDKINGSLETVGIAVAIYLISKSIFEIPVGVYIDRTKSEKDDLYMSVIGTILMSMVYFSFVFVAEVWHLYLMQGLMGLAAAIAFPGWYSIFTKHVDKGKEGFEWSLYDVVLGLGMAGMAALGGFLADAYGFNVLFFTISWFTLLGALLLLLIKNRIYTGGPRAAD